MDRCKNCTARGNLDDCRIICNRGDCDILETWGFSARIAELQEQRSFAFLDLSDRAKRAEALADALRKKCTEEREAHDAALEASRNEYSRRMDAEARAEAERQDAAKVMDRLRRESAEEFAEWCTKEKGYRTMTIPSMSMSEAVTEFRAALAAKEG